MESAFVIIAEPNRRAILSLLASSEQCVGDIERQLRMPQPTVSKHLRVLREAGFVESRTEAQRRLYRLRPGAAQGTGRLARSVPALLVKARRCPGETPGSNGRRCAVGERKEKKMSSREQYRRVPRLAPRFRRMATSGRSFSSATSATRLPRSGRRSLTPSIYANGLRSILTGTSGPSGPQRSRRWERRRRRYPRATSSGLTRRGRSNTAGAHRTSARNWSRSAAAPGSRCGTTSTVDTSPWARPAGTSASMCWIGSSRASRLDASSAPRP